MSCSKKQALAKLIRTEPVKIARLCGFKDMGPIHNRWLKRMLYSQEDMTLLAHRGSYKTTCLSVALALMIVLWPDKKIIFLRKTDTDVVEVVEQVQKILETGAMQRVVQIFYGLDLQLVKGTSTQVDTNLNSTTQGAVQLLGIGTNGSLTGKHADIVITDDIVNLKDRASKAERDRVKRIYNELQNVKNRCGRIINTGTPWHKEDAISEMPNVEKYDCYTTGMIDKDTLQALRESMTPSLFAANYELRHIADGDALFGTPHFTDDETLLYDGIAHIDAAYGGEDDTALTIIKKRGDKLYIYGRRFHGHVDNHLKEIYGLHSWLRAGTVYCEDNADKGYLRRLIKKDGLPARGYHESMNKFIKITTYGRANWQNVVFLSSTDPDYIAQILDYTEDAEHDDAPDSLASAIRICVKGGHVKSIPGGI